MRNIMKMLTVLGGRVSAPSPLLTSIISYWKLDETSDGSGAVTRVDAVVASANDLTDTNTTASGTGKISNGAAFVRANSEALIRLSNASLQTGNIDFTFACWCNFTSLEDNMVIARKQATFANAANTEWRLSIASNRAVFAVSDGVTITAVTDTAVTLTTATWYLIVGWHDAANDTINVQVNNSTPTSAAYAGGVVANTQGFAISGNAAANFFNGTIDEAGFWKRVLTSGERTSLYNGGNGTTYPFLGT